jgi:hypothetical protein
MVGQMPSEGNARRRAHTLLDSFSQLFACPLVGQKCDKPMHKENQPRTHLNTMKITRTGATRNRGTKTIGSGDLTRTNRLNGPNWESDIHHVQFGFDGDDRGSSYRYSVTLSTSEVLSLVDLAINTFAVDPASRAVAVGSLASLRELLVPKVHPAQSKCFQRPKHPTPPPTPPSPSPL